MLYRKRTGFSLGLSNFGKNKIYDMYGNLNLISNSNVINSGSTSSHTQYEDDVEHICSSNPPPSETGSSLGDTYMGIRKIDPITFRRGSRLSIAKLLRLYIKSHEDQQITTTNSLNSILNNYDLTEKTFRQYIVCGFKKTLNAVSSRCLDKAKIFIIQNRQRFISYLGLEYPTNVAHTNNNDNNNIETKDSSNLFQKIYEFDPNVNRSNYIQRKLIDEIAPGRSTQHANDGHSNLLSQSQMWNIFLLDKDNLILSAVIIRLVLLHELLILYENKDRFTHIIYLFMDCMLDLCNAMKSSAQWKDSDIIANGFDVLYYPHGRRFIHAGDLPDLTPMLYESSLWYEKKPCLDNDMSKILHIFASKVQNHRCQKRSIVNVIKKYTERPNGYSDRIILSMVKDIIYIGLMGNYPGTRYRPRFDLRMKLRQDCLLYNMSSRIKCLEWMSKYSHVILSLLREFNIYTLRFSPSCLSILLLTRQHYEKEMLSKRIMDYSREIIDVTPTFDKTTLNEIMGIIHAEHIKIQTKTLKPTKIRKSTFLKLIKNAIESGPNITELTITTLSDVQIECIKLCAEQGSKNETGWLEIDWLPYLGFTAENYQSLKKLYFNHELRECPDDSIKCWIKFIMDNNHNDYFILALFIKTLVQCSCIRVKVLPKFMFQNQIEASRARFNLYPWNVTPNEITIKRYCKGCFNWADTVFSVYTNRNASNGTRSSNGSSNNTSSNYTNSNNNITNNNNNNNRGNGSNNNSSNNTNNYKSSAFGLKSAYYNTVREIITCSNNLTPLCRQEPLAEINLAGKAIKLITPKRQKRQAYWYTLCATCGVLTTFSIDHLSFRGPDCGNHRTISTYHELRVSGNAYIQSISMSTDLYKLHNARKEFNIVKDDTFTSKIFTRGSNTNSYKRKLGDNLSYGNKSPLYVCCQLCSANVSRRTATSAKIINDVDIPYKVITAFFCRRDSHIIKKFLNDDDITSVTYSKLLDEHKRETSLLLYKRMYPSLKAANVPNISRLNTAFKRG